MARPVGNPNIHKSGVKFQKGTSGNYAGRPPMPAELAELRERFTREKVEATFIKYMLMGVQELELIQRDMTIPALDHIIIQVIAKAGLDGDTQRLNFLLDRTIGKVIDKTENMEYKININTHLDMIPREKLVALLQEEERDRGVIDMGGET